MADIIYNWLRSIVIYTLLSAVIINMLPSSNYKKYINLFMGLIFIVIILKPVKDIFGMNFDISINYLVEEYHINEKLNSNAVSDKNYKEKLVDEFEENVSHNIKNGLEQNGYAVDNIQVCANDDGIIESMDITVAVQEDVIAAFHNSSSESEENVLLINNIKILISQFYNMDTNNINVEIKEI